MNKSLTVRFLEQARAEEAIGLLSRVFHENADTIPGEVAAAFSGNTYRPVFFEAIVDDRLVGVIACTRSPRSEQERFYALSKLAVDLSFRKAGIGHALTEHAEGFIGREWLRGKPGMVVLADGTKINNPASRFYERMGYKSTSPSRSCDGGPILEKRLN